MERQVMWSPWMGPGLEHLHIFQPSACHPERSEGSQRAVLKSEEIVADGLLLGVDEQVPFRLRYEIRCNSQWRLRAVHLSLLNSPSQAFHLFTDEQGSWTTESGEAIPSLKGCLDVDISATPFTNTLPIRRLALQPGSSATLSMAYIEIPQMRLKVTEQRYTCLEATASGGRYRYESLENGVSSFSAELPVDGDGLVFDYPGLFKRVGTW